MIYSWKIIWVWVQTPTTSWTLNSTTITNARPTSYARSTNVPLGQTLLAHNYSITNVLLASTVLQLANASHATYVGNAAYSSNAANAILSSTYDGSSRNDPAAISTLDDATNDAVIDYDVVPAYDDVSTRNDTYGGISSLADAVDVLSINASASR